MYLFPLFLPVISWICTGLFGKALGKNGVILLNISCMILTFLSTVFIFLEVCIYKYSCVVALGSWIRCGLFDISFEFLFDSITATMLLVVSFISLLVHLYSIDYMKTDPHFIRFLTYLTLFTFFMFILLTAGSLLQFFAGWEGVGLASYLLINFWFTRTQANISALKALIVNRFGDFAFYIALLLAFFTFKSLNFYTLFAVCASYATTSLFILQNPIAILTLISLFLFIGAVGKSAQLGLHVWLPDAMEGPTPVSALIHAATMVTAGIFLLIRCSAFLEYAPIVLAFITITGALTAFFAATVGLVQTDLKKIIAYSTCSQLGYMIFACGLSNYNASFFHLINHAFFKALLFLCAGSIIHAVSNEQDVRKMGGLAQVLPVTYSLMLIGTMSLVGFPFLTGFYSKDSILEIAFVSFTFVGLFAYWFGTLSVFLTAFYSFRLLWLTFWTSLPSGKRTTYLHVHEAPFFMRFALIVLAFGSISWGFLTKDLFIGLGVDAWKTAIFFVPGAYNIIEAEFWLGSLKLIPLLFSFAGIISSFCVYTIFAAHFNQIRWLAGIRIYNFLSKKWFFDRIYNVVVVQQSFWFSYYITLKQIDRGLLELFGPFGLVTSFSILSNKLIRLQSGFIYQSIFLIALSLFAYSFGTLIFEFDLFIDMPSFLGSAASLEGILFLLISLLLISGLF